MTKAIPSRHPTGFRKSMLCTAVLAALYQVPAHAACTITGTIVTQHCGSDYVSVHADGGSATLTVDGMTTQSVELRPGASSTGPYDQTINLTGNTVINNPSYSGVIMQTNEPDRNATVNAAAGVSITSTGGFGGIWVRNDTSGNVTINTDATVHATGSDGVTGTTNGGSVLLTNGGQVTSTTDRGLYADGGYNNPANDPALVSIVNTGDVSAQLAGARSINYQGLSSIENSGTITSATRQGMISWSANGPVSMVNSGTVYSNDDHALQAATDNGDITVTNSGTLTSVDDTGISVVRTGYSALYAESDTGNISVNNQAGGIVNAADDFGIVALAGTAGNISVTNAGTVNAQSGINAITAGGNVTLVNSGNLGASAGPGMVAEATGNISLTNSGTVTAQSGLSAISAGGTVTIANSGSLTASAGMGMAAEAAGSVSLSNSGTVTAQSGLRAISTGGTATIANSGTVSTSGQGIVINGTSNTLTNSGTISSNGSTAVETGHGNSTITNSGTIDAGSNAATAIAFGNGNDRLVLTPGSTVIGQVNGGGGTNVLELTGTGTGSFNASAVGGSGQYQNFDSVEKTGTGTWQVSGASNDPWRVLEGTLSVSGSLPGVVAAGGTVSGTGNIGTVVVASGGRLAPGNSIGTVTASTATFNSGSTYAVEVNSTGASDKLVSTGNVTLNNGAALVVTPENGTDNGSTYANTTRYTIITAAGGVTGAFSTVQDSFAFLDPVVSYDAQNVYLSLLRTNADFASVAHTTNQRAVARAVEPLGLANPLYAAILPLSADEARRAYDALSGEVHASTQSMLIEDSRFLRDAVLARSGTRPGNGQGGAGQPAVWGNVSGTWGHYGGDGNAAGLDRNAGSVLVGGDAPVANDWRVGVVTGYTRSDADVDARRSNASVDGFHLGGYATTQVGQVDLSLGAAYTWNQVKTRRTAEFSGFHEQLDADYNAGTTQAFGEVAYRFETATTRLAPFFNLAYVNLRTDGFKEDGGDGALRADSSRQDMVFSTLGMRVGTRYDLGASTLKFDATLGWMHRFGDDALKTDLRFASGSAFGIYGISSSQDSGIVELGLTHELGRDTALRVSYSGLFASDTDDQGIRTMFVRQF